MCKSFCLFLFILMIISSMGYGQAQNDTPVPTPLQTPKPYEEKEFPQWLKDLRRGEVIMVGSIPFTFFVSIEIFDIYRFVSADFDTAYAPWPFKGQEATNYLAEEKINIIITAVSLSVCIAIADYIIVRTTRGKRQMPKSKK